LYVRAIVDCQPPEVDYTGGMRRTIIRQQGRRLVDSAHELAQMIFDSAEVKT
jgi:hypothetical protein